jgi:hypothetical protein
MMMKSSVSSTIAIIDSRVAVVEITMVIVIVNAEVPAARPPVNWAYEVICSYHQIVLPVIEYVAKVGQTI